MAKLRIAATLVGGFEMANASRVIRRLEYGTRPVGPVVVYFARKLKQSVDADFREGGRSPARWRKNAPNTIAAKGHGRVLQGAKGSGIQKGMRYIVAGGASSPSVNIYVPFPGAIHQAGVAHSWIIRPVRATALAFTVAGPPARGKRKASAQAAFARFVVHPGLARRPFLVIREELLAEGWRAPLRAFLFEGKNPPPISGGGQVIVQ